MTSLLIPDLLAMALMLGVLAMVHRRYKQYDIRFWMVGLLLILLECVSRILYGLPLPPMWHRLCHIVALDAYLLAGVFFVRSARIGAHRLPRAALFKTLNTAPASVLLTGYGAGVKGAVFYIAVSLCGIAIAIASSVALRRPRSHMVAMLAIWLPVAVASFIFSPRVQTYVLLALLYLLTAVLFALNLPKDSSGKIAMVTGFAVWAACFATHPWVATLAPEWNALASEIWNMQKFLITVGLLVVLFERQVNSNEWLALHDDLTGLPNRRLFQDRISNAIARADRDRTALILFCLDLNNFKEVNDTLGHDAGDLLLRKVAESLKQVVRRTDTLARMGGDEFTLLATDVRAAGVPRKERRWRRTEDEAPDEVSPESASSNGSTPAAENADKNRPVLQHASRIEQDIRAAVNKAVLLQGHADARPIEVSVSIGVAVYPTDSTDMGQLCRIADQRMYDDKSRQKNSRGGLDRVLSLLTTT